MFSYKKSEKKSNGVVALTIILIMSELVSTSSLNGL